MNENRLKWSVARFVVTIAIVVGLVVLITVREGNQANDLREGLITNCEKNGNPLREVLQKRIHHEIEQTQNKALLEKLFPTFSEAELDKLISTSTKERREEIKEVAPINCQEQYK